MRNLKRVLSLALASAMLLGMMVIGAGAANTKASDLTDMDKVTNKEAVNLMVDLGIITGKPDGSYAPAETVDRATMSTLIYKVLEATSDASSFVGATSPLTDVKGNWAEGYINYCYSLGIVAGTGDNTYNPGGKVAVVSAAKMLLVSLGYDPVASKYQNDSMWSINIMRDAQAAGLMNGISQKSTDELTRDNAAQMIFNALFAKTVTPKYSYDMGVKYIDEYVKGETLGYNSYSLVKVTGTVTALTDGKAVFTTTTPGDLKTNVSGKVAAAGDMLGKTAVVYVKATKSYDADTKVTSYNFDKIYSSTATVGKSVILGTSTDGTMLRDNTTWTSTSRDLTTDKSANKGFIADMDMNTAETDYAVSVFQDGAPVTPTNTTKAAFALPSAANTAIAKKGTIVELIDSNNNGKADIIKITEKKVYTLSADAATKVVDKDTQVRVPGVTGLTNYSASNTTDNVKGFEGLKKDDVVLVSVVNGVYFIEKAEFVEGVVAGTNNSGEPKIETTYYKTSGLTGTTNDWTSASEKDWTNTYKFYLDNGKNIVKTVKVTDEDVAGENTILLATKWQGGDLAAGGYMQAKFLMTDGTTEVVKLAKVDGTKMADGSEPAVGKFYTYTVNADGNYEIKLVTKNTTTLGSSIKNNTKSFDGKNLGGSDTKFVVEVTDKDGDKTYKTYTGIASVPAMSTVSGEVITKDGLVTVAYVKVSDSNISGLDSDAVYFYVPDNAKYSYYPKTSSNTTAYYDVEAYMNGDKTTVKISDRADLTAVTGIYTASTVTDNGVYTNTALVASGANVEIQTGIKVASGGTLQLAAPAVDAKVFSYDSETEVYYINTDKELSVGTLKVDANDKVTVIYGANNYAKVVFIEEVTIGTTGFKFTVKDTKTGTTQGAIQTVASGANDDVAYSTGTPVTVKANEKVELVVDNLPAGAKLTSVTGAQTLVADKVDYVFNVVVTAEDGTIQNVKITVTFTGVTAGT